MKTVELEHRETFKLFPNVPGSLAAHVPIFVTDPVVCKIGISNSQMYF